MALTRFGFIVTGKGLSPVVNRQVMRSSAFEMIVVGISAPEDGPEAARALLKDGVQLIELCGGFGPKGAHAVLEAVAGAVPVGSVGYGPESIDALYRLFAT
ncbi:DUF6506 family protein [Ottowia testudinis]|uniref:Uncharacterized protein n=1 Tax=Ottowia testudinis TaxID=2816950 RepID=A0A975CJ49_9BURK|nr:DUF6506 family protein [Ottowia testudinis]QTD47125.1 hypothetical protein J1M35_09785 [Ottowia testudinis]